jgi:hypothetical protein
MLAIEQVIVIDVKKFLVKRKEGRTPSMSVMCICLFILIPS